MGRRIKRCILSVAAAAMFVVTLAPSAASAAVVPKTALVYGDSLSYESRAQLASRFTLKTGWTLHSHTFGQTSPCDWLQWLPADLAAYHPSVVALLSAGNNGDDTMCIGATTIGSPDYYAKYRAYLDSFFATATASGAKVVFFAAPPFADPVRNAAVKQLKVIATELAHSYDGVSIANGVRSTLGGDLYTAYKPCLGKETAAMGCVAGQIAIRTVPPAIDAGLHLCPTGLVAGTQGACATYSSGEYRFAVAMTNQTVAPPAPILPSISLSAKAAVEGSALLFTTTLKYPYSRDLTLCYNTSDGTATAADYTPLANNCFVIPARTTTGPTIAVSTLIDHLVEPSETVRFNVWSPTVPIMGTIRSVNGSIKANKT